MVILIVDGDLHRQRQLKTVLSSLGLKTATIECASDFKSAITVLRQTRFDCCFVAANEAREETIAFLNEVRQGLIGKSLTIIAYSPSATREDVVAAVDAGADTFLAYPFTPENVEQALNKVRPR
jgi:CheY-like chemotaxis protein